MGCYFWALDMGFDGHSLMTAEFDGVNVSMVDRHTV